MRGRCKRLIQGLLTSLISVMSWGQNAVFHLEDYGCKGDGKTNELPILRKVAAMINDAEGGTVVFEQGKIYRIELDEVEDERPLAYPQENSVVMNFYDCKSVKIDMNGATMVMAKNHRIGYAFFHFLNCGSFSVSNGRLIGDAVNHDFSDVVRYGKKQKSSHEWGYGIVVNGAKGTVRDMDISFMTGDAIKSGSISIKSGVYHASVSIENTDISYCRRNGIAVLSSIGTSIVNTNIHHIGSYGKITGTAPMAGIDIEYEDQVWDKGDIVIRGCRITDCTKKTISASNSTSPVPKNFLIEDCYIEGSSFQVYHVKKDRSKIVRNCEIVRCPIHLGDADVYNCKFDLGHGVSYVSGGTYKGCTFIGTLEPSESNYGCTIAGTSLDMALFENCTFSEIRAANNNSPTYQGFAGYHFPLCATFRQCEINNCSFVRGKKGTASSFAFYDTKLTDHCMIYNLNDDIPVTFNGCELTDVSAYQTQTGRFNFKNSTLFQRDKSVAQPLLLFGNNLFNRCTIVDEVGFPSASAKRHGIKSYKVDAVRTSITLESDSIKTEGMNLQRGQLKGISRASFKGSQRSVKFK